MRISDATPHVKRPRRKVWLTLNAAIAAEIADLQREYEAAVMTDEDVNEPPKAPEIQERIQVLEDEAADSQLQFTFEAIPNLKYRQLIQKCPPSEEDIDEAKRRETAFPDFSIETFPIELIAAMVVEPIGTSKEWFEFCQTLSDGQLTLLFTTAFQLQLEVENPGPKLRSRSTPPAP